MNISKPNTKSTNNNSKQNLVITKIKNFCQKTPISQCHWLMLIILATQVAKIMRIEVQSQLQANSTYLSNSQHKSGQKNGSSGTVSA
jgi:hypothetical protein